jgi:type IV pilus assembly protein PilC
LPALYARVVRSGVETGQLPATLLNLSHHLRLVAETRRLLAEALTYPAIVLVLAVGVFCAVLLFVVPQFADAFTDFGVRLPGLTLATFALAQALPEILTVAAIVLVGGTILLPMLRLSATGRSLRERTILAIPLLGPMILHSLQARFLRAMAFAVDSRLTLPEAIRLSAGSTGSPALMQEAARVAGQVEQGGSLDQACRVTRLMPAMFGYFVAQNSDIPVLRDGLIQLSKSYDARAVHYQSLLRGWGAPLAIVAVSLVIGLIIIALFMPLVQLIQSVSG